MSAKQSINYLSDLKSRIVSTLPAGKDTFTYLSIISEYLARNPDLMRCKKASLDEAIINAAMLGLELGEPFDLAEIIPFKSKDGPPIANLIIEYRGHMVQAYVTGKVKAIEGRAVYEEDRFDYSFGLNPSLTHRPSIAPKRGPIIYAYAIAQLEGGGTAAEVITRHDADKARADSPGSNRADSLWVKREAQMWIKTAIKKLANRFPRSPALCRSGPGPPAPAPGRSGPGPPAPEEYAELINALLIAPDLYNHALSELSLSFPSDSGSIKAVLDMMRQKYRTETTKDQQAAPIQ